MCLNCDDTQERPNQSRTEDTVKTEREYEELRKMADNAGLSELMTIYGEYKKLMELTSVYLQEMSPKFHFSTSDSSA